MAVKGTVKIDSVVCSVTKLMEEKGKKKLSPLVYQTTAVHFIWQY